MHAPGPWHVDGKTVKSVDHQRYYTVARVDNNKFTPEANAANARLIAKAPAMLDVLRRVADFWAGGDVPEELDRDIRALLED